jgi:4-amino-4-deoxy-L-arabinose transferase-like glycosyltransferase
MVTASVLTGILFLILLTSRLFGRKWGIIAGLLFASTPGIVVMSHEAKPHAFGILFICLTLYFSLRLLEEKKNRFAFLGGASSGLVAGSLYPYGLFLLYPLLAGILQKRALHKILLVLLGFALLFSLTNFYLFLTPSEFIQEVKINKQILGSFSMKEFFSLLPALALLCGWILIPFSILGVILLWKDKKIFLLFVPPSLFSIIVLLIICGEKTSFPLGAKHFIFCLPVFVLFAVVTLRKLSQRSFYFGSISGLICGGIFLYLTISYLAGFAADCSELNTRIISGRWINRHIPKSSSIGTIYRFSPYYAPPFCFARYKLIAITGWEGFQQEMLPKYLLLVEGPFFRWGIKLEKLLKNYRIFKMFKNPFNTPLSHANDSIYIYKRITKYPRQFLSL